MRSKIPAFLLVLVLASSSAMAGSVTSSVAGTIVDPSIVNVYLNPIVGDSVTFQVCVTVPSATGDLDLLLLEDLSGSFSDDLGVLQGTGGVADDLVSALSVSGTINWGVASFVDKPWSPFGSAGSGDYVYKTDLALTSSSSAFLTAVDGLSIKYGNDTPEAQLEALQQVGLRVTEIGWRAGAKKIVVLSTDAGFHVAGDYTSGTDGANDGDTDLEDEDYPTIQQVKDALVAANVVPIFAVTSAEISTYQGLVDALGFGTVVLLSSDSSNLVAAIEAGLSALATDVTLEETNDDFGYLDEIDPTIYEDVLPGDEVCFDVTLTYKAGGLNDTFYLVSPGFGICEVNVDVGAVVPLPSAALMGLGLLAGLGAVRRIRRRR